MSGATRGFLARNFLLIAKLLALIVLFFALVAWAYYAYAPTILEQARHYLGPAEYLTSENVRLSSLSSFLSALFQGNLGRSYQTRQPVWNTLAASLETTVLLIVLSSAISVATGAFAAFVALRFKSSSRRQFASAFSRKGFFFALTTWTGFVLIMILSFYLGWFPSRHTFPDYWLIHPPESILVEIEGRLRHLSLPLFTLMIVFMIRSFSVVWSDNAFLTSRKDLWRLLLPSTATDFACIVSAVVLVENVFGLPGVGYQFLTSIDQGDFALMIGAFIVLLGVAVILGYFAVLLDFVHRRYIFGEYLNERLVKTEEWEMPERKASTTSLKLLARQVLAKKSLVFGILIVLVFVIVGLIGPLLTPFLPSQYVAEPYSPPIWVGQLLRTFGILGTDAYGRDIFTQTVYAARAMLISTIPLAIAAALIGLGLGSASRHLGKWADNIVVLFADTTLTLPILPLLVVVSLAQVLEPQVLNPLSWTMLWVLSALVAMASKRKVPVHEKGEKPTINIQQNRFLGLIRDVTANFSFVMASLALLSLVGYIVSFQLLLGPVDVTWSRMLSSALYSGYFHAWWIWVPPLGCILLFATGFLLIGLGLDRRL